MLGEAPRRPLALQVFPPTRAPLYVGLPSVEHALSYASLARWGDALCFCST